MFVKTTSLTAAEVSLARFLELLTAVAALLTREQLDLMSQYFTMRATIQQVAHVELRMLEQVGL